MCTGTWTLILSDLRTDIIRLLAQRPCYIRLLGFLLPRTYDALYPPPPPSRNKATGLRGRKPHTDAFPTVDDIHPALPIYGIHHNSHSLGSLR